MQHYDQSDGGYEDEVVSSTISEPSTDQYDDEEEEDDEFNDDRGRDTFGGHSISSDHVVPQLATLLNGPQWQQPDPRTRRAARVDYNEEKLAQARREKTQQTVKVRAEYLHSRLVRPLHLVSIGNRAGSVGCSTMVLPQHTFHIEPHSPLQWGGMRCFLLEVVQASRAQHTTSHSRPTY
jgi:hypothetical protein